jgi:hypothetical protein
MSAIIVSRWPFAGVDRRLADRMDRSLAGADTDPSPRYPGGLSSRWPVHTAYRSAQPGARWPVSSATRGGA